MTKTKSTKRALLLSALSLLMCVSMLIGSTFAWFTDSVTSGSNVIQSGNLDVEVKYTLDGDKWNDLNGAKDLFQKGLWEPGHTEVVVLKIENKGSLALKYVANMNIINEVVGTNKDGSDIVLSDILTVKTLTFAEAGVDPAFGINIAQETIKSAFKAEGGIGYGSAVAFKNGNILEGNEKLLAGEIQYVAIEVDMAETVGNEANHNGTDIPSITFGVNVLATQFTYENDSFGNDYDENAVYPVVNAAEFQQALDVAEDGDIIQFNADFTSNDALTLTQKKDVKITIDGNNRNFNGTLLVDGKSATITTAGVTIKNMNFTGAAEGVDACIQLGNGENATRYTCNVTIEDCTFAAPDMVGVKSYTGGDKNLVIRNCTATAEAHSLAQLKGIDGVLIENCTVKSIRGINFNNSNNITVAGTTIDVQKYGLRFGESANDIVEEYKVVNCTITSDNLEGDAAIVLRAGATNANLTLENTTITATTEMSGHEDANITVK